MPSSLRALLGLATTVLVLDSMSCAIDSQSEGVTHREVSIDAVDTPVGLAFEVDNGVGVPLEVRAGQTFFINQIDLRASVDATTDEGISGLARSGDFASLDWRGSGEHHREHHHREHDDDEHHDDDHDKSRVDQSFAGEKNPDGTFTRRRFYRGLAWMRASSTLTVEPIDAQGRRTDEPIVARIQGSGGEHHGDGEHHHDDEHRHDDERHRDSEHEGEHHDASQNFFFTQRLRAIQWTNDCRSNTDCAGASHYSEEALVELRYANRRNPTFKIKPNTTALRVTWSLKPGGQAYTVPITQVANPPWDYGFGMDIKPLTAPGANGAYAPGQKIAIQFTLMDGAGKRLHAPGVMPSFRDFMDGKVESGIMYWRGFAEPNAAYYRRKHREGHLNFALVGPLQSSNAIYNVVDIAQRMNPTTGMVVTALPAKDGFYAAATAIPAFTVIYGDPSGWTKPSTDTWTFELPADSKPGTYDVVLKGRRKYLGEDIPASKVLKIQVGTPDPTTFRPTTAKCEACHKSGGELRNMLHGLDDRSACAVCHAPLSGEMDNQTTARIHFIHSRTSDYGSKVKKCGACHLSGDRIDRPSKGACLSCHRKYPSDHERKFGPITDSYTGGGLDAFQQCTDRCHRKHDD